ncbi:polyprenyl synthetase family protein [bacterium]|jgi:geranylgeranyl pyrophosphate synthase|nr:polyprenyl synthetase family protein [bacterium]
MNLSTIFNPVKNEMAAVETLIADYYKDTQIPVVQDMSTHLLSSAGKRVRAAILFLIFRSLAGANADPTNVIRIAGAIESIHLASLIHDDIIDEADQRRGQASLQSKWGPHSALVMGVYIYSISLKMISDVGNMAILDRISDVVKQLCEGELLQLSERYQFDLSIAEYLQVIEGKTAVLFDATAYAGATLAGADNDKQKAMARFGTLLGIIFQITDDYLDLFSDGESLNKDAGQDLLSGEITLPFLYLLDGLPKDTSTSIKSRVLGKDPTVLTSIQELLSASTVAEQTRITIKRYLDEAKEQLSILNDDSYRKGLYFILDKVAERCFSSVLSPT